MRKICLSPKARQASISWAFLLPNLIGVLCFTLLPMIRVLVSSLQSAVGGKWVGLRNYVNVWSNSAFQLALSNTVRFVVVCIPILLVLSLAIAVALHSLARTEGPRWGSGRLLSALEEWVEQAPGRGREKESRRQKLGRLLVKILRKIRKELIGC